MPPNPMRTIRSGIGLTTLPTRPGDRHEPVGEVKPKVCGQAVRPSERDVEIDAARLGRCLCPG